MTSAFQFYTYTHTFQYYTYTHMYTHVHTYTHIYTHISASLPPSLPPSSPSSFPPPLPLCLPPWPRVSPFLPLPPLSTPSSLPALSLSQASSLRQQRVSGGTWASDEPSSRCLHVHERDCDYCGYRDHTLSPQRRYRVSSDSSDATHICTGSH